MIDIGTAFVAFIMGLLAGYVVGDSKAPASKPEPKSTEWEVWFRYYLDNVGPRCVDAAAAHADAAMKEIKQRRDA